MEQLITPAALEDRESGEQSVARTPRDVIVGGSVKDGILWAVDRVAETVPSEADE